MSASRLKKPMDKAQIIALCLVVALVLNSVVHWVHPAYRYYKAEIARQDAAFDKRFDSFVRDVQTNIVPAIVSVSSNNLLAVRHYVDNQPRLPVGADLPSYDNQSAKKENKPKYETVDGRVFSCGRDSGVWIDGIDYYVGDYYLDGVIVDIRKGAFVTTSGLYVCKPKASVKPINIANNQSGCNANEQL